MQQRKTCRISGCLCGLWAFCLLALAGCALFRADPLAEQRGAVVLVFDTRTAGDMRTLRRQLSACDARATFFAFGQVRRDMALTLMDLRNDGHAIGLSGLKGVDAQLSCSMYGRQKYFQDEIVPQVLGVRGCGLNPGYFLLYLPKKAKPETLELPAFIASKGFERVVDVMPGHVPLQAKRAAGLTGPVVHAYPLTTNNFDRAQIAALAKRNEILVVAPNRQVLPLLLDEARTQGVPFATLADLK